MGPVIGFMFAVLVVVMLLSSSPAKRRQRLLDTGTAARGILLEVSSLASGSIGTGLAKLQQRQVTIDVEIPGRPPYVVTVLAQIPLNLVRDVLPGATMELRVDKGNPNNIAIVGPGVGFNPAMLMTQGQPNQGAS